MTRYSRAWAVAAIAGAMAIGPARADPVSNADADQVRALIADGVKIVDIRRPDEWRETGVIEGSVLLTAIDGEGRLVPEFPAAMAAAVGGDEPVVLICRSGNRSTTIARLLSERAGYTHVVNADGGIRAWLGGGNPVTPCPKC